MRPPNGRRRYIVASSLIGLADIQNDPWRPFGQSVWLILILESQWTHLDYSWMAVYSIALFPITFNLLYGFSKCFQAVIRILNCLSLQWRHKEGNDVSIHQPHDCLLSCLFSRRSKKTPKLRVTGLCEGNSPVTGEIPAQRTSNAEYVSNWWRHHGHLVGG